MDLSDVLNSPTEIEFEGKTYLLRRPTQMERGEYEQWVKKLAFDEIERREYKGDAAEREARRERAHNLLTQDIAAGVYDYDGPVVTKSLKSDKHFGKLLSIILRSQGVTHEIGTRIVERERKLASFATIRRVFPDPKDLALVARLMGLPEEQVNQAQELNSSSNSSTHHSTDTTSETSPTINSSDASTLSADPVESPS